MTTPLPHLDGPPHLQMAPAVFPDDFDPDTVPRYPVVVVEVTAAADTGEPPYTVRLNGQDIPIPPIDPDQTAETALEHTFGAAVTAAAKFIHQRGWAAARVNAVGPDGQRWPMIIGRHGEQHDLTAAPAPAGRPRWFLPAVVALVVVALAVAAVAIALRPTADTTFAAAPPSVPPTVQPAELPVLPPAGYSTHARWAYGPLAIAQSVAIGPTGILARGAEQLTLLDPATGQPTWSTEATGSTTGPWSTTVAGTPAAVTLDNTALTWRPWTNLDQATTLDLGENATVSVLPGGVVVALPDQQAQLLTATGLTNRLIPAGASAVGVDVDVDVDDTILWASNGRQLWRLDRDAAQTPAPVTLRPPVPGAQPTSRAPVWKAGRLLTTWTVPANDREPARTYATLHDGRGNLVKALPLADATLAADQYGHPRYTAIGSRQLVDHQAGRVINLPEDWQTTALVEDYAFGLVGDRAIRYTLTTGKVLTGAATAQATPVAVVDGDLLSVAALSDGVRLYRLTN